MRRIIASPLLLEKNKKRKRILLTRLLALVFIYLAWSQSLRAPVSSLDVQKAEKY